MNDDFLVDGGVVLESGLGRLAVIDAGARAWWRDDSLRRSADGQRVFELDARNARNLERWRSLFTRPRGAG